MHNETDICMKCQSCNGKWYSLSGKCPKCLKANGYPSDSLCITCYKDRKKYRAGVISGNQANS